MRVSKAKKAIDAGDLLEKQAEQARKAHQMRLEGRTWWDIAESLGISERTAMTRVDDAIRAAVALVDEHTKRSMLALEMDRMDALHAAFWPTALGGDVRAAELILKISGHRAKLMGLDSITSAGSVQTVIVQGTSDEYISALRAASAQER